MPLKAKIFSYCSQNINPPNEMQINEWLADNPDIEVIRMVQSESMVTVKEGQIEHNLSLTVLYREPA